VGGRGAICKERVQDTAPRIFFDDFLSIFGKKFVVIKDRIVGNAGFMKTVPSVTDRPNNLRPSRREVKNDVWKYLQMVVIGLYAVCEPYAGSPGPCA